MTANTCMCTHSANLHCTWDTLEILISEIIFTSFSTSWSILSPHHRTTDSRSLSTQQTSGSPSKPEPLLGSTWHREFKCSRNSCNWLPVIKQNAVRFGWGFSSPALDLLSKSVLLWQSSQEDWRLLDSVQRLQEFQDSAFSYKWPFQTVERHVHQTEEEKLLLKVFSKLAASTTSQRSWVLEQRETVLGRQLGVHPNSSYWKRLLVCNHYYAIISFQYYVLK